jgi:hypothetical protein
MMATARARRSRRAIRTSRVEDAPDDAGVVAGGCLEGADVAEEQAGGGPASPSPPRSGPQPPRSAVTLFTLHGSPATLVALLGGRRAVPPDPVAELLEEALSGSRPDQAIRRPDACYENHGARSRVALARARVEPEPLLAMSDHSRWRPPPPHRPAGTQWRCIRACHGPAGDRSSQHRRCPGPDPDHTTAASASRSA